MSLLPLRPCTVPGCPALIRGGRCARHTRQAERVREEERGTSTERGYDQHHRRIRIQCFMRDNWRCVDCGWEPDLAALYRKFDMGSVSADRILAELRRRYTRGERHLHADHIIPISEQPGLRLDL